MTEVSPQKLISIIVPDCAGSKELNTCVDSILSQTHSHLEVLLLDEGSSSESSILCAKLAQSDERVKVFSTDTNSEKSPFDQAVDQAQGDYIGFVSANHYIMPTMYEYLLGNIEQRAADLAACRFYWVQPDGKLENNSDGLVHTLEGLKGVEAVVTGFIIGANFWNKLFKRTLFNGLTSLDVAGPIDRVLLHRVAAQAQRSVLLPRPKYYYPVAAEDTNRAEDLQQRIDRTYEAIARYRDLRDALPNTAQALLRNVVRQCLNLINNCFMARKLIESQRIHLEGIGHFIQENQNDIKAIPAVNSVTLRKLDYFTSLSKRNLLYAQGLHVASRAYREAHSFAHGLKRFLKRTNARLAKHLRWYRTISTFNGNLYARAKYKRRYYNKYAVRDKVIMFESFWGRSYSDSPKALYETMLSDPRFKDYEFIWAFRNVRKGTFSIAEESPNNRTSFVKWCSRDYFKAYASAQYFIRNVRISPSIIKKPEQIHIQTWHGTPLKRLVHDVVSSDPKRQQSIKELNDKFDWDTKMYNYMLSPSKFCTDKLRHAFQVDKFHSHDIMIEEGYPRNDLLINASNEYIATLKDKFEIPADKKVILYAPTWRDEQHTIGIGFTYDLNLDFSVLREKLEEDYVIIFRTHYHISNSFNFDEHEGFIYDLSRYDDVNHLYLVSDMLITDYSSVFFDYANLERPLIFYMYDLEHYATETRGFYIDLKKLPGPIVRTEEELLNAILDSEKSLMTYSDAYRVFNAKYNYLDDGGASERVINRIFGADNQGESAS